MWYNGYIDIIQYSKIAMFWDNVFFQHFTQMLYIYIYIWSKYEKLALYSYLILSSVNIYTF